jgi:hypothetical protein
MGENFVELILNLRRQELASSVKARLADLPVASSQLPVFILFPNECRMKRQKLISRPELFSEESINILDLSSHDDDIRSNCRTLVKHTETHHRL